MTSQRGSVQLGQPPIGGQAPEESSLLTAQYPTLTIECAGFDLSSSQTLPGSDRVPRGFLEKLVLKIPKARQRIVFWFLAENDSPQSRSSPATFSDQWVGQMQMVTGATAHSLTLSVSGALNITAAKWLLAEET